MGMAAHDRLSEMTAYIASHGSVELTELCVFFNISMSTLRRDLKLLADEGKIQKKYGFVISKTPTIKTMSPKMQFTYHERGLINTQAKEIAAFNAAAFVEEGDVIFIDTGSTTPLMVDYLTHFEHLTIVTNNLDVVIRARPYENLDVYVLPGLYKRKNNSFSLLAESYIYDYYNISKAFLSCSGVSLSAGISHTDISERLIKNCTIDRTEDCYLLADHTKFNYSAPLHLCPIEKFKAICTDERPPVEYIEYCKLNNVQLRYDQIDKYEI